MLTAGFSMVSSPFQASSPKESIQILSGPPHAVDMSRQAEYSMVVQQLLSGTQGDVMEQTAVTSMLHKDWALLIVLRFPTFLAMDGLASLFEFYAGIVRTTPNTLAHERA